MGDDVRASEVAARIVSSGVILERDGVLELTCGAGRRQGVSESSDCPTLIAVDGLPVNLPIKILSGFWLLGEI
jgi:hypothetical protein